MDNLLFGTSWFGAYYLHPEIKSISVENLIIFSYTEKVTSVAGLGWNLFCCKSALATFLQISLQDRG
jgi:hypothetical protein